jgi:hypothetical protein
MQHGETLRPRSGAHLSAWCKTATMADRLHIAATLPPREAIEEALKLAVLLLKREVH